ncbi:MAG: glycosyltransferase family 2 protein [Eubacteriales bacterium]|nr:glycosyltransferase family 2 protein [Eubacteriales bacterium]
MEQKLLTVTVPAYNAEKYLDTCLASLCREAALSRLEVLVINDGSTDGTKTLAESWQARYPDTVRVITKENGGHGSGINTGIREASGRYFKIVDADDWVDANAFLKLLKTLEETNADAVVSGFYWAFEENGKTPDEFPRKAEIKEPFPGVEYGKLYRFNEIAAKCYLKMHGLTWRTDVLRSHEIRVDENCYYVDTEYILYPIPYIETVLFIPDFVYQYRIGRSGQSVSPERMQKNAAHYDRVMKSVCGFTERCRTGDIPCTPEKLAYINGIAARAAAGKIKVILSFPPDRRYKEALRTFDQELKKDFPDIYAANRNKAVKLLRMSNYLLYRPAAWMLRQTKR